MAAGAVFGFRSSISDPSGNCSFRGGDAGVFEISPPDGEGGGGEEHDERSIWGASYGMLGRAIGATRACHFGVSYVVCELPTLVRSLGCQGNEESPGRGPGLMTCAPLGLGSMVGAALLWGWGAGVLRSFFQTAAFGLVVVLAAFSWRLCLVRRSLRGRRGRTFRRFGRS